MSSGGLSGGQRPSRARAAQDLPDNEVRQPSPEADPYRDAGLTPEQAARLRAAAGQDTWVTRDGRELSIKQMYRPHLGNAQAVLTTWIKREKDTDKKRELKRWRSKMRRELAKREKAWRAKRKAEERSGGGETG